MRLYEILKTSFRDTRVSWKKNRGIAYNESVTAGLRLISEDDDIALEYPERAGYVMVTGISVQHNGYHNAGRASDVIKKIISWANDNSLTLLLVPSSSGRLDNKSLNDWYSRYGFSPEPDGSMIRLPN